ncbi:MAG: hypothetical protein EXS17_00865 [Phycisphaerales bacterium]|nr:hypothetical protein [Phycisphaerales bacterium]
MDAGANLRDARTLMAAKAILVKAGRSFATAIEEAQSDAERFGMWLDNEGQAHWERQRRLRTEKLNIDKAALFRKQIQMTADGRPPSVVDEKRAVARSELAVQQAEAFLRNLKRWRGEYQRLLAQFRAGMNPLSHYVDQVVPTATAALNRMAQSIDGYLATTVKRSDPDGIETFGRETSELGAEADGAGSMRRSTQESTTPAVEPTKAPPQP